MGSVDIGQPRAIARAAARERGRAYTSGSTSVASCLRPNPIVTLSYEGVIADSPRVTESRPLSTSSVSVAKHLLR